MTMLLPVVKCTVKARWQWGEWLCVWAFEFPNKQSGFIGIAGWISGVVTSVPLRRWSRRVLHDGWHDLSQWGVFKQCLVISEKDRLCSG